MGSKQEKVQPKLDEKKKKLKFIFSANKAESHNVKKINNFVPKKIDII
jgi:hypothetical protein